MVANVEIHVPGQAVREVEVQFLRDTKNFKVHSAKDLLDFLKDNRSSMSLAEQKNLFNEAHHLLPNWNTGKGWHYVTEQNVPALYAKLEHSLEQGGLKEAKARAYLQGVGTRDAQALAKEFERGAKSTVTLGERAAAKITHVRNRAVQIALLGAAGVAGLYFLLKSGHSAENPDVTRSGGQGAQAEGMKDELNGLSAPQPTQPQPPVGFAPEASAAPAPILAAPPPPAAAVQDFAAAQAPPPGAPSTTMVPSYIAQGRIDPSQAAAAALAGM